MRLIRVLTASVIIAAALITAGCGGTGSVKKGIPAEGSDAIMVNQVGYNPGSYKIALVRSGSEEFEVINGATGKRVFRGTTGTPSFWPFSGDTVRSADFSSLTEPGVYRLRLGTGEFSWPFEIKKGAYTEVNRLGLKSFYLNRSGFEITSEYGGKWARPAGHPDTAVLVHASAATAARPAGTVISSPGGWYDAGDYNKYIVNSSISVYTMLLTYQVYTGYCDTLTVDIPEKTNDLPDAIDEILYNLRWMLTMQDPHDGGVYHKLTNKEFGGFEMPHTAVTPRYVVMKSTQATLDFAATMAMASRVFGNSTHQELQSLSPVCLDAARNAMKWAQANPSVIYIQPADIKTGEYGGRDISDEWFWAETEMALAENLSAKTDGASVRSRKPDIMSWGDVEMLGIISLALSENPAFAEAQKAAAEVLTLFSRNLLARYDSSAYKISLDFFKWGSNSDVANQALIKILARRLTCDNSYDESIQGDLDYILGRNATGYSFITGAGSRPPVNIHHRPSGADGVPEPVPGFLAGGPNTVVMDDCKDAGVTRSSFPAKSYSDSECSYSTNEICINWNAPLFFVLTALDAEPLRR